VATTGNKVWELTNSDESSSNMLGTGEKVRIKKIEWHPNAADNDLDLEDANGLTIMKTRALIPAATHDEIGIIVRRFGGGGQDFVGFVPTTIDGGTVYVYLV